MSSNKKLIKTMSIKAERDSLEDWDYASEKVKTLKEAKLLLAKIYEKISNSYGHLYDGSEVWTKLTELREELDRDEEYFLSEKFRDGVY